MNVKLRAAGDETYDDNITYIKASPLNDFITHLNLGVDAIAEEKLQSIKLSGDVHEYIFADHGNFDNTAEQAAIDFSREFSKRDRIHLNDTYSHTYEPQSFEDAFGRSRGRYGYHRNNFSISYEKDVLKQLTLGARYSNQANLITTSDIRDSYLNLAGADAVYHFDSKMQAGVSYDFSQRSFENGGGDSHTHGLSATVRHYLTEKLYFDGKAGADFITGFDGSDLVRPHFEASLTEEISKVTTGQISFRKEYNTSSFASDLFNEWRVSAFLTRYFTERFKASASVFYGEGEYPGLARTDKLSGAAIGLSYDLKKNLSGNIQYSYSNVNSTQSDQEYTKNSVSVGLSSEF